MKKHINSIAELCRADPDNIIRAFERKNRTIIFYIALIVIGSGIYGATIGLWRAPLQAFYTAIKFPLLILFTTIGNTLLNGMLAQLLGINISFRQSLMAIFASFAIASVILASLSPITLFMILNTPPLESAHASLSHNFTLIIHVFIIAFAGISANICLFRLLLYFCKEFSTACKVLFCWLLGNMFLGCQLSWIMRPFVGCPTLPIEFFRSDAFNGNFYESVFRSLCNLLK